MTQKTKFDTIGELLRRLGLDLIDLNTFWHEMERQKYTQEDIDEWCKIYYDQLEVAGRAADPAG